MRELGIYVHVPWCRRRCGYCAFNTWVLDPADSGDAGRRFVEACTAELALAGEALGRRRPATSVFVGGGTPSLLDPAVIGGVLDGVRRSVGLAADAEVTVEANPDDVDRRWFDRARTAGVTRVSLGMQSAVPAVLEVLDRAHRPDRPALAAAEARSAGFDHVSLDLIHGTPGETAADWARTLDVALGAPVDHLSAYALAVEPGTRLAARVRGGTLRPPSPDEAAERYEELDRRATAAGLAWYELSNWARGPAAQCRHNLLYWRNDDWWGVGPGAHSHLDGTRWWNVDHPDDWAGRLASGRSPRAGVEVLTPHQRDLEHVLLGIRLAEGLVLDRRVDASAAEGVVRDGLAERRGDRLVLTLRGRLLADRVVDRLTDPVPGPAVQPSARSSP